MAIRKSTSLVDAYPALATLIAENAEAREIIAARQRVRDSFKHSSRRNGKCRCVYCRRDAEGLAEHAADYELKWFHEISRRERAEAEVQRLRRELAEMRKAAQTFAVFIDGRASETQ